MSERLDGRVQVSYGGHGAVLLDDGEQLACRYRRQVGRPVCGDRVSVAIVDTATGVVEAIHPRENQFLRGDRQRRPQLVAANLDQVLVVIAVEPAPSKDLVERYLVAVHSLGIEPVLVVNKVELAALSAGPDQGHALARLDQYRELGYTVIETSCKSEPGIDALSPAVAGRTSILVGQSGVGKSSLVHALLPDLDIQVGRLSRVTGKGTHTTTTTTLYVLPGGGFLMDSPGVWEYGLWALEPVQIAQGFAEFRPFLGQCRFNDCRHASEPGCAIKAAVDEGLIPAWRHASYLRLCEQNERGF